MAGSGRQEYIRLCCKPESRLIHTACRRLARALNYADDRERVTLLCDIHPDHNYWATAHAWMTLAFLLADTCDIDSVTLNAIAKSVQTEVQDVIL